MFTSFVLQTCYASQLSKLRFERRWRPNITECQRCAVCCWQRPCNLVKEDVPKISEFLGITPEDLFEKYLVVDDIGGFLVLIPRRVGQEDIAGQFVPSERTFDIDTPCVFLDDKKRLCTIHAVKPLGGKTGGCWDKERLERSIYEWKEEDLIKLGWDGNKEDE